MNNKRDNHKVLTSVSRIDNAVNGCAKILINRRFYAIVLISIILTGMSGLSSVLSTSIILTGMSGLSPVLSTLARETTIRSSGTITRISPLHVGNGQFEDRFGNTVYLRGVLRSQCISCVGMWQPEGEGSASGYTMWDESAVRLHMQQLKDYGMNVMRWIMNVEWWQKNLATSYDGRSTDRSYRECIKDAITIAQEYGIYIILCWYVVRQGVQPHGPYPPYSNAGDEEIIPDEDAFVSFWVDFAQEMKGYPNVLYEVFNEPVGMPASEWFDTIQRVIDGIRTTGDDHIILAQYAYCGAFEISEFLSLNDTTGNLGYANHIYRFPPGATMGHTEDDGVPAYTYDSIKRVLTEGWWGIKINYDDALQNNIPIIITEFGPWNDPSWNQDQEQQYYQNTAQILNEWNISYTGNHWDHPWVAFRLQDFSGYTAPFPLNQYGQILVDKIAEGKT